MLITDDNEEEEEEYQNEDVDIEGTEISLTEPPYSRKLLKKICDRGDQYTSLIAVGDWEAWLEDLRIVVPHLHNVTRMRMEVAQCGCDGLTDIIDMITDNMPHLVDCDLSMSFEKEPMDCIARLIRMNPILQSLNVESDSDEDEVRERVIVAAIKDAVDKKQCSLTQFVGFPLSREEHLTTLGLPLTLLNASNAEVLKALHAR